MPLSDQDPPADDLFCEGCGSPIPAGKLGAQCPRCLLSLASGFGLPGESETADHLLDSLQVRYFGDYELVGEIARGGMGIVYRARQITLKREVAIKMILAGELAGKDALRMFQIEARAAANLHHPNIVPVYEIGERETQHYFTMRFVPGGMTIADWAREHRKDDRAIATAAAKVARAVAYAHSCSILHRDLKPSNILWDAVAGPQITDFGLAKVLDGTADAPTRSVHALGSPSYMAPEQMNGRTGEITTATDVYGIGAVLYEMLSGRPPFAAPSALETMRRAAEEAPAPLPNAPRDLRTICLKCLAKDQNDRYATAAALADDLERFARGEPVSAAPLALPQILWRWAKRQPRMAALLALCLVFLLVGVSGVIWQWRKAESARAEQAAANEHLRWQHIDQWVNDGDAPRALAYLASLIREKPGRWEAAMYAMSIVDQLPFAVLAGPEIHPPSKLAVAACLAPDGSWIAGAGEDRVARVWDTASGREIAQFPQKSSITALSAGGGRLALAVATDDGGIAVWRSLDLDAKGVTGLPSRADARAPFLLPRSSREPAQSVEFSADGSRILARSANGVEVWNCEKPLETPLTLKLDGKVSGVELSADGGRALLWNAKEAVVWDAATGREILRASENGAIRRATLAATGARMALISARYKAVVWDVDSGSRFSAIESRLIDFSRLALNAGGDRLTLAGGSNDLVVFDVASGLPVSPPMRHHYSVTDLRASPDGTRTASYGRDDMVMVWDAKTGRRVMSAISLGGAVRDSVDLRLSRDGRVALVRSEGRNGSAESLMAWRSTRKEEPPGVSGLGPGTIDSVQMSPDKRWACVGLDPTGIRIYPLDGLGTGRVILEKPTAGPVYAHFFSPDARRYYAVTGNGWLYGWSMETGEPLWKPNHQPGFIRPAAISPDGARIIAGHNDGHIRIYDTATGEVVRTLDHPGEIKVLRFAPDRGGRFVTGSTDRLAHVWDLQSGRKLQTFAGHTDAIISAAWSPDNRLVATASFDHTVRVWDAVSGRSVCPPLEHIEWLSHIEFSPDGKLLATACRDGTARLWNPRTGLPMSPPLPQRSTSETVHFSSDGAVLFVRDHDGFRFWDAKTAEPVTGYYFEPHVTGLGFDDAAIRDIMAPDGRSVLLGHSMTQVDLWTIPQPREPAPAWFPDFLEMLAQEKESPGGEVRHVSWEELDRLWTAFQNIPGSGAHASWAKKVLRSSASKDP